MGSLQGASSSLLTIPLEVRNEIYGIIFSYDGWLDVDDTAKWQFKIRRSCYRNKPHWLKSKWTSILNICRQIYNEAEPVLYKSLKFHTTLLDHECSFFKSLSTRARLSITTITLDAHYGDSIIVAYETRYNVDLVAMTGYIAQHLPKIRVLHLLVSEGCVMADYASSL